MNSCRQQADNRSDQKPGACRMLRQSAEQHNRRRVDRKLLCGFAQRRGGRRCVCPFDAPAREANLPRMSGQCRAALRQQDARRAREYNRDKYRRRNKRARIGYRRGRGGER